MKHYDEVLTSVGSFGIYQFILMLWFELTSLIVAPNMLFMAFGGKPAHATCNISLVDVPVDNGTTSATPQICTAYDNHTGIDYPLQADFYAIADEWHLWGDLSYVPSLCTTLQMAGVLVGASLGGIASDRWGRKPTYVAALLLSASVGGTLGAAPNWHIFAVGRAVLVPVPDTVKDPVN